MSAAPDIKNNNSNSNSNSNLSKVAKKSNYFHFSVQVLGKQARSLIFDIYLYAPHLDHYEIEWKAHHKIPADRIEEWEFLEIKGFRLAVAQKDKQKLLLEIGQPESVLQSFKSKVNVDEQTQLHDHQIYQQETLAELKKVDVKNMLHSALDKNDFFPVLQYAQKLIFCFDLNHSITASNARALAELLNNDHHHLRIAALTVVYAHALGHVSQDVLADLFCAAMLKDMGIVFINFKFLQDKLMDLSPAQKKEFWQHGAVTLHLLRKSGIQLSERCMNIIQQHHETPIGTGFPQGLGEHQTEPLSYILGIVEATFMFANLRLNNHQLSLKQIVELLKEKKSIDGMLPYPIELYQKFALFLCGI